MIKTKTKNSITFHIETLERPDHLVEEKVFSEIAQKFSSKIEYLPNPDEKLIDGGSHAFLYGLYLAYSEHRPFTLSPDMIWLLVLQGISNHVNFSHENGNNLFPHLTEKKDITIINNKIILGDPKSPWHETTEEFSKQIEKIVGSEIVAELRADFSTTTLASKVVNEITIMDTFRAYFEYIIYRCICGIPEMTLQGSIEDWNHLLSKLEILNNYDLKWWYEDLKPIVTKIRNTAQESIDNEFWMNIFKIHTIEEYGSPKYIDGWITKFFPFAKNGGRINLKDHTGILIEDIFKMLPKQMVHVDFKHVLVDTTGNTEKTAMEYWGGFVGIIQDQKTQSLTPKIDWFVSHAAKEFERDIDIEKEASEYYTPAKIFSNLKVIPGEVFSTKKWDTLALNFVAKAIIPEQIKDLEFNSLYINGTNKEETEERLKSYFNWRENRIYINGDRLGVKIIPAEEYQKYIEEIKEKYIPTTGRSTYVQGEMMRAVEKLEEEAIQHLNKNFTKVCHGGLVTFLEKHLYDEDVYIEMFLNDIYLILDEFKKKNRSLEEIQDHDHSLAHEYNYIKERIVDWHLHYGPTKLEKDPELCL